MYMCSAASCFSSSQKPPACVNVCVYIWWLMLLQNKTKVATPFLSFPNSLPSFLISAFAYDWEINQLFFSFSSLHFPKFSLLSLLLCVFLIYSFVCLPYISRSFFLYLESAHIKGNKKILVPNILFTLLSYFTS